MEMSVQIPPPTIETYRIIAAHAENARQAIRQTFFQMGKELKKKTSDDILDRSTKTGRVYWVRTKGGRRRRHQASAPGETHANLSGALRRSIGYQVHGTSSMDFGYGVDRPTTDYARRIELGGTDARGITIEARPSLANNIKNVRFETFFDDAVNRLVSK